MNQAPVVFVVDDDASVRNALANLLCSVGLNVQTFGAAQEFLSSERPDAPGCLVLDVRLPGLSGLDLQRQLAEAKIQLPIIFITGHGDIQMSVDAMKAGAVEFLTKPFREQVLLDAIQQAVERDRAAYVQRAALAELRGRYQSLTPREQEIMGLVVRGLMNKQSAGELGTTEATVKVHRAKMMHKLRADSLADLIRMAEKLGLPAVKPHRSDAVRAGLIRLNQSLMPAAKETGALECVPVYTQSCSASKPARNTAEHTRTKAAEQYRTSLPAEGTGS